MKKIFIAYNYMMIGGSTTSLLSILNNIDYTEYEVDLLLMNSNGELINLIPSSVNILPEALHYKSKKEEKIKKILSPISFTKVIKSRIMPIVLKKYNPGAIRAQIINLENARLSRRIIKEYDVAIGFIETWATYYVANHIKARKKIAWYHLDYIAAGFFPKYDRKVYEKFDNIVLVSEKCKENFECIFPVFSEKTVHIDNILSKKHINNLANIYSQSIIKNNSEKLNIITVCRISFEHKGLDRAVRALKRVVQEFNNVRLNWYIIGDGEDLDRLKELIIELNLDKYVYVLGSKINPMPYIKESDLFLLPSKYEGKPMAVTEAQLLGIPPIVTEYASAHEQIENNVDGIILKNSEQGIYEGFRDLFNGNINIKKLKKNLELKDYSNISEMKKIIKLVGD